MGDQTFSLAADFQPEDRKKWRSLAQAALKGAPVEKLVRRIHGLSIEPLYTRDDRIVASEELPGVAPYTRGSRSGRTPWAIQQVYAAADIEQANRAILSDLERGVTAVELALDDTPIRRLEDLLGALIGVFDDLAPIGIDSDASGPAAASLLLALWAARGRDRAQLAGFLNVDPVGAWATGRAHLGPTAGLRALGDIAHFTHHRWPQVRAVRVDGSRYHDAGATEIDELTAILATGVAYLSAMIDAGLTASDSARQVVLRTAVDADLFMGISKVRALRQTWARVLAAAGAEDAIASIRIEVTMSRAMMTRRDPWVNILRGTVATFAAAVAGADTIHTRPFDEAVGLSDDLARRIARNTQVILQDESHLDQVIDPAGGSWHVENLTRQLAEATWQQFQAIERDGGIVTALRSGSIQDRIDATWGERRQDIARRKQAITGISEFPHLAEERIVRPPRAPSPPSSDATSVALPTEVSGGATEAAVQAAAQGATVDALSAGWTAAFGADESIARPLPIRARAASYEALRDASDRALQTSGHRPQVLLAKLGPLAEHTARVTYARNFFEAGGIAAVDPEPVDGPESAARLSRAHATARLAVICGADGRYADEAAPVAAALKAAGIRTVYLAGRPGEQEQTYRDAGIDEFIYIGANVLDVLERAYVKLGQPVVDVNAGEQP